MALLFYLKRGIKMGKLEAAMRLIGDDRSSRRRLFAGGILSAWRRAALSLFSARR